jgi:hypothetical protein
MRQMSSFRDLRRFNLNPYFSMQIVAFPTMGYHVTARPDRIHQAVNVCFNTLNGLFRRGLFGTGQFENIKIT